MGAIAKYPACPFTVHSDCFAKTSSKRCYCLEDTDFKGNECPFYKPEGQVKNLVQARSYKEAKDIKNIIK